MRILLTGGGTAGHALPVILVAEALKTNKRNQLLYIGAGKVEKELVAASNLRFKKILAGKRRAYFSLLNFLDLGKTLLGIIEAFFILLFFRPDIIFAKGGYVTVPIIFWTGFFKIPMVIHESDSVMGRANLWAVKKARKICLGFPVEYYQTQNLPLAKIIYTGIPVGQEFFQTTIKDEKRAKILITGGSQGSTRINQLISQILPELVKTYEVWHLSGENDYQNLAKFKDNNYHLYGFSKDVSKLMRDADLVITRGGANTLAEISASKKAAIIIPLPESASDHQTANAKVYQNLNAAVVLKEESLSPTSLKSIIDRLMEDENLRKLMGHHAYSLARPQAAREIVDVIFEAANGKN